MIKYVQRTLVKRALIFNMYGYTKTLKATICLEYRTINITSIDIYNELHKRKYVGDDAHSGFHHSDGTREGLLDLTLIYERHSEVQKDIQYYEKAFESVRHERCMQSLGEIRVDVPNRALGTNSLRIMNELSDVIHIQFFEI